MRLRGRLSRLGRWRLLGRLGLFGLRRRRFGDRLDRRFNDRFGRLRNGGFLGRGFRRHFGSGLRGIGNFDFVADHFGQLKDIVVLFGLGGLRFRFRLGGLRFRLGRRRLGFRRCVFALLGLILGDYSSDGSKYLFHRRFLLSVLLAHDLDPNRTAPVAFCATI